jgi:molecular chaperone DnaK
MGTVIGIDLGTTNTAVAVFVDGRPQVLEDKKAYKVLPSVVWIGDGAECISGMEARKLMLTDPGRTAYAFKRLIGRHFDSEEVQEARRRVGYDITEAADGQAIVLLDSGPITPVELSAKVLMMAKNMASRTLGETIEEAVVTVPAYFNHAQRAATMEAIQLAGLRCERLLNEPTAAALAYGYKREVDKTLLVFDLGGGTFDVSVLRMSDGVYEILSTLGDSYLGGMDFDHRVVDHLADKFSAEFGVDLRTDRATLHRLADASERAKCELSFTEMTQILVRSIASGKNLEYALDRATLEGLVGDLVDPSSSPHWPTSRAGPSATVTRSRTRWLKFSRPRSPPWYRRVADIFNSKISALGFPTCPAKRTLPGWQRLSTRCSRTSRPMFIHRGTFAWAMPGETR